MLAALAMYDLPELAGETDAWWRGLRRHLESAGFSQVPESLDRRLSPHAQWRAADLLLAQTCGYPLTHAYDGALALLATPCYDAPGCTGSSYSSAVVVAAASKAGSIADLRGAVAAYNAADSFSGHLALRSLVAPLSQHGRFFGRTVETGAHVQLDGARGRRRGGHRGDRLRHLCPGVAPAPGARRGTADPGLWPAGTGLALRHAPRLVAAAAQPSAPRARRSGRRPELAKPRAALLIGGIEWLPAHAYRRILALEAEADAHGYTGLN